MENQLRRKGNILICGIDEVGRGCLAGPFTAAAVILPAGCRLRVRDSKLLTKLQRQRLAGIIRRRALAIGVGWVTNKEIDLYGVTESLTVLYERALADMNMEVSTVVIDGNYDYLAEYGVAQTLIRADQKVSCVAAASIIAKEIRDSYMHEIAEDFPQYGFESHVGYATHKHRQAIESNGLCSLHRKSYCGQWV